MAIIERRRELLGGKKGKAFADCTWTEIKAICDAGEAATYIANSSWKIGDINTTVNYGSDTGGIQLVHCLTEEQRGSSKYNTNGHIVCQFVNTIAESTYMSSNQAQKYFEGTLHTTCNDTIYNGLDSTFKALLESWTCKVAIENSTSSTKSTGLYTQTVYLAEPTCKEARWSNSSSNSENWNSFIFDYYNTDSTTAYTRRGKSGVNSIWWTRSPDFCYSGSYHAYAFGSDGGSYSSPVTYNYGVAPIMVI